MIKVGTVCSGIGSPEQALKELKIKHSISFACEIDKYARQTYLANFKPKIMLQDMTTEDWTNPKLYSDLIIGGIPCQSFSLAGKRKGELDPRGTLFYNFYDYIKKQQPKYFIIENVKGLLSDANGRTFQNWLDLLSQSVNTHYNMFNHDDSLLYNVHWTVLNSKDFGVPQNRERVFIVGLRNDLPNTFRFPIEQPLTKRLKDVLQETVDEKYYLSEKMLNKLTFNNKGNGEVANINKGGERGSVYSIDSVMSCLSATDYKQPKQIIEPIYIAHLQRTDEAKEIRKQNMRKGKDYTPFQAKEVLFRPAEIMNTITCATQKDNLILTNRIRRLTPLECMRLQGFPDSYKKVCSETQQYKMAGNTITVNVIKSILKNLLCTPQ